MPYPPAGIFAAPCDWPVLDKWFEISIIDHECGTGFPVAIDPDKPTIEFVPGGSGGSFTDDISRTYDPEEATHVHGVQESYLLLGTDPSEPEDLGGECEVWLGLGKYAEKHVITKSSSIVIPPGLGHHPMIFRNIRRPIILVVIFEGRDFTQFPASLPPAWNPDK
jgi:hypothetical protein